MLIPLFLQKVFKSALKLFAAIFSKYFLEMCTLFTLIYPYLDPYLPLFTLIHPYLPLFKQPCSALFPFIHP